MQTHIDQICAALSVGLVPPDTVNPTLLAGVWFQPATLAAIDALPREWKLAPDNSYCPMTFDPAFGVPEGLTWENSYIATPDAIFAAGDNGESLFYFKFIKE